MNLDIPRDPPPLERYTAATWPYGIMNSGIRGALPSLKFMKRHLPRSGLMGPMNPHRPIDSSQLKAHGISLPRPLTPSTTAPLHGFRANLGNLRMSSNTLNPRPHSQDLLSDRPETKFGIRSVHNKPNLALPSMRFCPAPIRVNPTAKGFFPVSLA
jgi:hypothetical protein